MGAMGSQILFNLVDTAMVGSLGPEALAAVGLGGFFFHSTTAFVVGLAVGVQATVSRRVGEGQRAEIARPLNEGLVLALLAAIPTTLLLVLAAPTVIPWLIDDPTVQASATPYVQLRAFATAALGMNFAYRSYWNAIERASVYMRTLVAIHIANLLFNWIFIFGHLGAPALGAEGAGLATCLAAWFGSLVYFATAWRSAREEGFARRRPQLGSMLRLARVAVPAGVQQTVFFAGLMFFMALLARLGTVEVAAGHVIMTLLLVGILPSTAFGIAAATLVGQSLGQRDKGSVGVGRAREWGWRSMRLAAALLGLLALPALAVPERLLGFFTPDAATIAAAVVPLRLLALTIPIDACATVLLQAHLGAGASRRVLLMAPAIQWGLFAPGALLLMATGVASGATLWAMWILYRIVLAALLAVSWRGARWASVAV